MDIIGLLRTGAGMAAQSAIGDMIHDYIEKVRGKQTFSDGDTSQSAGRTEKIKPFLGLAVLSREDNHQFTRIFDMLSGSEQAYVAEFLLEYYIRPAQNQGLITQVVSAWQFDQFMLNTVNLDTPSKLKSSAKVNEVKNTEAPGTTTRTTTPIYGANGKVISTKVETKSGGSSRTATTTDKIVETFTSGGTESLEFLRNLGLYYRDGGMKAAEDYHRLNKMPTMDPEILKKVEDFIKELFGPLDRMPGHVIATLKSHDSEAEAIMKNATTARAKWWANRRIRARANR